MTSSTPQNFKQRSLIIALGLGLLIGPAFGAFKYFASEPSQPTTGRQRMTIGDARQAHLILGVTVIVPLGLLAMWGGGVLLRIGLGPVATESDLHADPDAPKFADSALICMSVGLGGGSAVIVDREAGKIHFRQCYLPLQPSFLPKAPQWHCCSLREIVRASHSYQTHQGKTTSVSFEIRTRDGRAIVAPSMTNYSEMCRCLEQVCPSPGDSVQAREPHSDTIPEMESVRRTEDDNALQEPLTSISATPSTTTRASLPTPPYGASFQETESGWCLTVPMTSIGTAIVSGPLLAVSAYGAFQALSACVLSTMHRFDFQLVLGFGFLALCVSLALGWQFARSIWGQLRISCDGQQLTVFQGVGSLGSTQVCDASRTSRIIETTIRRGKSFDTVIQLTGATQIHFGALLTAEHRNYIRLALCQLLLQQTRR